MSFSIPQKTPEFFQLAIHLLYGIVIAQAFLISADTLVPLRNIISDFPTLFIILAMAFVYYVTITSWIGYYKSQKEHPYSESKVGYVRFLIDLIIVFTYATMLISTSPQKIWYFDDLYIQIAFVFTAYVVWDLVKLYEYKKTKPRELRYLVGRFMTSLSYFIIIFFVSLCGYFGNRFFEIFGQYDNHYFHLLTLIIYSLIVFRYRYKKWYSDSPQREFKLS